MTLFYVKFGFGLEQIVTHPKSFIGTLKLLFAHIFGFGIFIFVIIHFLLFTPLKDTKTLTWLIHLSFLGGFLEIFASFALLSGIELFAVIKLLAFVTLHVTLLYALFLVQKFVIYH